MKKTVLTIFTSLVLGTTFSNVELFKANSSQIEQVTNETISFSVNGNAACKSQIETIITSIDGVVSATWNASTKIITIEFNTELVRKDRFFLELAEGGYDNQELRAKNAKYDLLSADCKYNREPEKE